MKATPSEIKIWKGLPVVKECYEKLHSQITNDEDETWCGKIISEMWEDTSKVSVVQIAFVITLCESFLNPNNEDIKNNSKYLKKRLKRNIVSIENIRIFFNFLIFLKY
jgi:23S rRNA U2552 (ribose-2'-O)-methylase RlmE/FtsJ